MPKLTDLSRALLATCLLGHAAAADDRAVVMTVNYPLAYFAETLGGDAVEVLLPVPEGVDPSFWRPAISDISAMQAADLILLNGAGFATWTTRASLPRSRIVDTSADFSDLYIRTETVTHSHGDGGEHSHTGVASYLWLDPELALKQAEAVAAALVARGLVGEAEVETRLAALTEDLATLDARLGDLETGPVLIATHPRYQYLARATGLTIESLEWDAGAVPTDTDLADLEALMGESGATILIWEADPGAEARAAVQALGLRDVIFPPFAMPAGDADFVSAMTASITALSAVLAE